MGAASGIASSTLCIRRRRSSSAAAARSTARPAPRPVAGTSGPPWPSLSCPAAGVASATSRSTSSPALARSLLSVRRRVASLVPSRDDSARTLSTLLSRLASDGRDLGIGGDAALSRTGHEGGHAHAQKNRPPYLKRDSRGAALSSPISVYLILLKQVGAVQRMAIPFHGPSCCVAPLWAVRRFRARHTRGLLGYVAILLKAQRVCERYNGLATRLVPASSPAPDRRSRI